MGAFGALGAGGFFILVNIVVLAALFELLDALVQAGRRPNVPVGLLGGVAMLLAAFYRRPELFGVIIGATTMVAFLAALRPSRGGSPASDVGWTVLGVAWIGGGGAGATWILTMEPGGLSLLVAFVLITALDDIGGYFGGTRFGKHKMAPTISPAKSWEGFAAGFLTCLAGGVLFAWLLTEIDLAQGLGIAAICGLLAPAGDLSESMVKREIGIKDSGRLLPGHGGFLDRLDAILFCAPVVALYLTLVLA